MEPHEMSNGKLAYNFIYQDIRTKSEAKSHIRNTLSDVAKGVDTNFNEVFSNYFERSLEINKMGKLRLRHALVHLHEEKI